MPMRTVTLGPDGIQATSLGFGCGALFRIPSPRKRSRLLHSAYDAGISYFDVAPMYGLGRAEPELGSFARTRRAELIIATKFGIRPTLVARGLAYAQRPVRRTLEAKPAIRDQARARAGRSNHLIYERGGYHAVGAKRSLERSLRALNTDYVDLFLLHDPLPGSVRSDEVSSFLEDARATGLIRSWGLAGEVQLVSEVARSFHGDVPVWQFRDDIFLRSPHPRSTGAACITFGVINQALGCVVQHVSADDSTRLRWQKIVGADCGDPDVVASFLLQAASRANSSGVVLFSTIHPSRVRSAVATLDMSHSYNELALDVFLRMVDDELLAIPAAGRGGG
jgi:D-threo-aldose 1-dehydrogenase